MTYILSRYIHQTVQISAVYSYLTLQNRSLLFVVDSSVKTQGRDALNSDVTIAFSTREDNPGLICVPDTIKGNYPERDTMQFMSK